MSLACPYCRRHPGDILHRCNRLHSDAFSGSTFRTVRADVTGLTESGTRVADFHGRSLRL